MLAAPTLTEHVTTVLSNNPRAVVIDLTDLHFLAAAGLEVLATAQRAAAPTTRVGVGRAVRRPIEITGIDKILPVFLTLSAALGQLTALTASMN